MVENTSAAPRRGRPPRFDADHVVDAAIGAFFAKGFDATTLADLEAATGVDRSTLYNSFGGKRGLYHKATERYLDRAAESLFSVLYTGSDGTDGVGDDTDDGLQDVVQFLERLRSGLTSAAVSPGCLIINDMAAGSDPDAARRYRELLDNGLRAALGRAAKAGTIDSNTIESRASLVSAAVVGINLVSRHTGDNQQVDQLVTGAITEVTSWRRHSEASAG
ncbi:MAG: TetR/AcrR family transcriptional regulator [Acidimicrobiia bacterium]|nr:TetR/AcrR family transcriptional regulator [Acidimicrobiia bacterium]